MCDGSLFSNKYITTCNKRYVFSSTFQTCPECGTDVKTWCSTVKDGQRYEFDVLFAGAMVMSGAIVGCGLKLVKYQGGGDGGWALLLLWGQRPRLMGSQLLARRLWRRR